MIIAMVMLVWMVLVVVVLTQVVVAKTIAMVLEVVEAAKVRGAVDLMHRNQTILPVAI